MTRKYALYLHRIAVTGNYKKNLLGEVQVVRPVGLRIIVQVLGGTHIAVP